MDELNNLLRQQADQLMLAPSPRVWEAVEQDIVQRERKRRWLFWVFVLAGLITAGLIIYVVYAGKPNNSFFSNANLSTSSKNIITTNNTSDKTEEPVHSIITQPVVTGTQSLKEEDPVIAGKVKQPLKAGGDAPEDGYTNHDSDKLPATIDGARQHEPLHNRIKETLVAPTLPQGGPQYRSQPVSTSIITHEQASVTVQPVHTIEKDELPLISGGSVVTQQAGVSLQLKHATKATVSIHTKAYEEDHLPEINSAGNKSLHRGQTRLELSTAHWDRLAVHPISTAEDHIPEIAGGSSKALPTAQDKPYKRLSATKNAALTLQSVANSEDHLPDVISSSSRAVTTVPHKPVTRLRDAKNDALIMQPLPIGEDYLPEIAVGNFSVLPKVNSGSLQTLKQGFVVLQAAKNTDQEHYSDELISTNADTPGKKPMVAGMPEHRQIAVATPNIFSAQPSPVKRVISKWSIGLRVSPNMSFSTVTENNDTTTVSNSRNATSKDRFNLNYGLQAGYQATPALQLYAGIGMHNLSEQMTRKQLLPNRNPVVPSGNMSTASGSYTKIAGISNDTLGSVVNQQTYLEVLLGMRYRLIKIGNFNAQLDAAVTFNRLMSASGYSYNVRDNAYSEVSKEKLKPWMVGYGAGISLQYNINKEVSVDVMPYYRRYPGSVYKDSYLKQYYQQAGVNLSVQYRLSRRTK